MQDKLPIRKEEKTGIYYSNFTKNGKRYRNTLSTKSKIEAINRVNKFIEQLDNPELFYTFKYCYNLFISFKKEQTLNNLIRSKTFNELQTNFKIIFTFFENFYIKDITGLKINDYISFRKNQNATDGKIKSELTTLNSLFNFLIKKDIIVKNPCFKAKEGLKGYEPRKTILNDELFNELINCCNICLKHLLIFLRNTGARISETLKLKRVDFIKENGFNFIIFRGENTKNRKTRVIPLNNEALQSVLYMINNFDSEYIFVDLKGEFYKTTPKSALQTACKKIGIAYTGFHILRHTFASDCFNNKDFKVDEIKDLLGHQSIDVTKDIYISVDTLKLAERVCQKFDNFDEK